MIDWAHGKPGDAAAMDLELGAASGERLAFSSSIEQQLERHFQDLREKIYAYLIAVGAAPADAEEITQEAFIRLYQQLSTRTEIKNVRAWLFRTARNLQLNDIHSWRATSTVYEAGTNLRLEAQRDPRPDPEAAAIATERMERLKRALCSLTPNQAAYLHLRAEGLRYREIAEIYGVTVSTVVDVIRRAVERLGKEAQ
jgi:RNA polymerase sigma-70 factor (ECF subfamily)